MKYDFLKNIESQLHPANIPEKNLKFGFLLVTPDLAKQFLKISHPNNRNLRESNLNKLVTEISSGNYFPEVANTMAITEESEPKVINNIHTLTSIVRSEKPVWQFIVMNADPESFKAFDGGASRSLSDRFKHEGILNHMQVSSAINKYLIEVHGNLRTVPGTKNAATVTPSIALDEYWSTPIYWQEVIKFALPLYNACKSYNLLAGLSIITSKYALWSSKSHLEPVQRFWTEVTTGVNLTPRSATLAFRNSAMNNRVKNKGGWGRGDWIKIADKAWNYFLAGREANFLHVPNKPLKPVILKPKKDTPLPLWEGKATNEYERIKNMMIS